MKPMDIKMFPDIILRQKCAPVEEITWREKIIFKQMLFTMHHFHGVGLAGPQVGLSQRLIVVSDGSEVYQLANPEIIQNSGTDRMIEGCLSISEIVLEVERAYNVVVRGLNGSGDHVEIKAEGFLARIFQHEIDHLNGKLIIDYRDQKKSHDQERQADGYKNCL